MPHDRTCSRTGQLASRFRISIGGCTRPRCSGATLLRGIVSARRVGARKCVHPDDHGLPVNPRFRPHTLGVDDGPFEKRQPGPVPIIGVAMEGHDVIESVALGAFPVDGEGVTEYLAAWIGGLRTRPMLQAVILGGITVAGLGLIDLTALSERLGLPVLVVTRHDPAGSDLVDALRAAGLSHRVSVLERTPRAYGVGSGLYLAHAGTTRVEAEQLVLATLGKARVPEPLRVAHLIGQAIVLRESRGRV
jgi:uncharacterized protein